MTKPTRLHIMPDPDTITGYRLAYRGECNSIPFDATKTEITVRTHADTLAPDRWGAAMAAAALMGWGDDYTLAQVPGKVVARKVRR